MKRILLFAAAAVSLVLQSAEPDPVRLTVYPKDYKEHFRNRILTRTPEMKSVCVYEWIRVRNGGVMKLDLQYRLSARAAASVSLHFRTKNGKQPDAGSVKFDLPSGTGEPAASSFLIGIPPEAHDAQLLISLPFGKARIELMKLAWSFAPDRVKLPGRCRSFYNNATGRPAKVQTAVVLTPGEKGVKIRFEADEPQPGLVRANVKKRDGAIWEDDCCEVFIFLPDRNRMYQFALNTKGVQFDAEYFQRAAGDPWRSSVKWNGEWQGTAEKTAKGYALTFLIPYKTLGYAGTRPEKLLVNFARERKPGEENSMWNSASGNFNEPEHFAELNLRTGEIIRCRSKETGSYLPVRRKTAGLELLSKTEKGNYVLRTWQFGAYLYHYPGEFRKKYDRQSFLPVRRKYLERLGEHGMQGPALPWSESMGRDLLQELHRKYGMQFPYELFGSRNYALAAGRFKAPLKDGKFTDPADPAYTKATLFYIGELKKKCAKHGYRELVGMAHGIDEPANRVYRLYSRTLHPESKTEHDRADREIRNKTGFGKYGLYDFHGGPDVQNQFRRIAFWRWWNNRFLEYLKQTSDALRKAVPGLPYLAVNRNNCGGLDQLDMALLSPAAEIAGTDPYPTSSKVFGGIGRAIYHTGFSVKLLHDLANVSRTCVMPQMFIYHGGAPTAAYTREWISQAVKNGAEVFVWYDEGPACLTIPDAYAEMLRLARRMKNMNRLPVPKETRSAVLYSDADRWGLEDVQGHPYYCVYSLLGEKLGANFRFVSPTGLQTGIHSLKGIRVLYIPRMRYARPEDVKTILRFLKEGGTLVIFDPNFWTYHYDGTAIPERRGLIPDWKVRSAGCSSLRYKGKTAPAGQPRGLAADAVLPWCFDFPEGFRGKILASYPDGKPAIIERNSGRGKVIVSACQPFGYSSVIPEPGAWPDFFRDICRSAGEKTDLPIWNFVFPAK